MADTGNKENQRKIYTAYFTTTTTDYDDFLLPPHDFIREKHFSHLKPKCGDRVLEIGIGISRAVRTHGIKAFALDYVATSLIAQKLNSPCRINPCRGDGEALPYKEQSFDFVVAISTLEHLSDFHQAFREIQRVLKPHGICLLQMPCKDFRFSLFARFKPYHKLKDKTWFIKNQEDSGHDFKRIPDRKGWKQLALQNGFDIIKIKSTDIFLDAWMMYYFFQFIKTTYTRIIRHKGNKPCYGRNCANPSGQERVGDNQWAIGPRPKQYSLKRKAIAFLWYHGILKAFWILLIPERILSGLPIGASIYLSLKKSLR